ncbi:MAG: hypothetical protein IK136_02265 [Oscillospiraceae bacterium]|nr:hypothetical protein [Oscillospiraceae bacterium]
MVRIDVSSALPFLSGAPDTDGALRELNRLRGDAALKYGAGWLCLPRGFTPETAAPITDAAARIRSDSDALVVVGAGGSFLGANAAVELLAEKSGGGAPEILFCGSDLSSASITRMTERLAGRDFSVNIVSKSGSTLEPLAAFHVLYDLMRRRYGTQAHKRVYATVGARGGPLRDFAGKTGATTFDIPEDVGGRYSVLTAVGLLPMAAAGIDIAAVMSGAYIRKYFDIHAEEYGFGAYYVCAANIGELNYCVVASKDDPALASVADMLIYKLKEEGTLAELIAKYGL